MKNLIAKYDGLRAIKFTIVTFIVIFSLSLFFSVPLALAATVLYEHTTGGVDQGLGQSGGGAENQSKWKLGNGLEGTVEEFRIEAKRVGINNKQMSIQMLCYDDSGYSTLNSGCSFNYYSGGDFSVTSQCKSTPSTSYSLNGCTGKSFDLDPDKYYALNAVGHGFAGTSLFANYDVIEDLAVYELQGEPSEQLTLTASGSTFVVREEFPIEIEWSNISFTPYYLYFYEDAEDTNYVKLVDNFPLGTSGGFTFNWYYTWAYTFTPTALIGNQYCTTPTASGCLLVSGYDQITVDSNSSTEDPDYYYDFTFEFQKYNDVIVGESVEYEYDLDTSFCTLSGAVLYKGYSGSKKLVDTGSTLSLSSGSGTVLFDYTNQPNSDYVYPRIEMTCNDGTTDILYAGSTFEQGNAQGISIYEADDRRFWYPTDDNGNISWQAGGTSDDYTGTGTGAGFWANKYLYDRYEPVKLKWIFNVDFTVGSVVLYPDPVEVDYYFTYDDASDLTENRNHYGQIEYRFAGEYQPMVQVRSDSYDSGNPATYSNIYLGGNSYPDNANSIAVTSSSYSAVSLPSQRGIFGFSPSSFQIELGEDANIFMKASIIGINKGIQALIWLASFTYGLIEEAPVFNWVAELVSPSEGITRVMPNTYFGYTFDLSSIDREYTISYASENSDSKLFYYMLQFIFAMSVIAYVIKKIF